MNHAHRVGISSVLSATVLLLGQAIPVLANLEIEGYYWLPQPDGSGSVGIDGVGGTEFNVKDDLGFDDPEAVLGATIIGGDRHQLGASFFQLDFTESNDVQADIRFSDLTFRFDTRLQSSLESTIFRGFYRYRLGSDAVRGGLLLGGQYTDFAVRASATGIGRASASVSAVFPVIGGFVEALPLEWLGFRGSVIATTWDFDDTDITFVDAEALVKVIAPMGLYGALGYRHLDIDGEDKGEAIKADVTFSGPVLFLGFQW